MDTDRISALLEPFLEQSLQESQLNQISIYIDLLKRWNARINLTAIRNEEEIVSRHFGESLFMARHLFPETSTPCHPERSRAKSEAIGSTQSKDPYISSALALPPGIRPAPSKPSRVLDIGSGAGFPGLPLKIWARNIDLTMIESNHKKAAFLREAARALTLTNVNVNTDRAETLAQRVGKDFPTFEVVTLRAVERFETILSRAIRFLAPNASLALLIGTAQLPHLTAHTTLKSQPPINVPQSLNRVLSISVQT